MDEDTRRLINSAEAGMRRHGKQELLRHLHSKRLTRQQAIKAKCYDCDGMGSTGICSIYTCSLYPYSSFKE